MNRIFKVLGVAAAVVTLLSSCQEKTPAAKPAELGEVTANLQKIGVNQQVRFSVPVTKSATGDIYGTYYYWYVNGNQILADYTHYEDGEFFAYYTPTLVGTIDVKLEVLYLFQNASSGEQQQTVTSSKEFEVVECDARSSFWGDSLDVTLNREPGLVVGNNPDVVEGTGRSSIRGFSSLLEVELTFTFSDGALVEVEELFERNASSGSDLTQVVDIYSRAVQSLETDYLNGVTLKVVAESDAETKYKEVADKFIGEETLTDDEKETLGEGMMRGDVRIEATCNTETTNVVFTTNADRSNKKVKFILTYSKR